jgi:hypothetical protein
MYSRQEYIQEKGGGATLCYPKKKAYIPAQKAREKNPKQASDLSIFIIPYPLDACISFYKISHHFRIWDEKRQNARSKKEEKTVGLRPSCLGKPRQDI